ncbi:hypothetical protein L484_024173 [Morus notabilis]|uniref:F-box/LRR-repeat protein n=1 Tax=Morus notabilis TaxID=981085 RepID=W9RMB7_9ROSA|nr:hypothetical protein L484_024173 [Morus notabilis]
MNLVEKSLHSFIGKKLRMQTFNLFVIFRDDKLFSMIDPWMTLALDNGVQEIFLYVGVNGGDERRYYALPETTFVVRSIDVYSKFYSLRKLTLECISISGDIIQKIIRNCPNLEYFELWNLLGLKTIEISKLDKLEVVVIGVPRIQELERVDIDAPNLKQFIFRSYVLRLPCSVNLTSCHHLKELVLSNCRITDDSFHSHLSRFPLLENLDIVDCRMLRRIRISAQRLKRLELRPGQNIEVIEIDAPTLLSFRFTAYNNMPLFFSKNVPCPMEI